MCKSVVYKRIILIMLFVCVSLCCYSVVGDDYKKIDVITTNALPVTNKIIVIDAGHGKPDEGAVRI